MTEALVGFYNPLLRGERVALVTPQDLQGALFNPLGVATGELDIGITTPSVTALMARDGTGRSTSPTAKVRISSIGGYRMLEDEANALFQEAEFSRVFGEIAESRSVSVLPVADRSLAFMEQTFGFARNTVPAAAVEKVRLALDCPIDPVYLFNETAVPLHDGARQYAAEKGYVRE